MPRVTLSAYREVLSHPGVRRLVLFSIVFRMPYLATGVVLTLHVVSTLGRGYGDAGLVAAVLTVATAIGQPVRGRAVDRFGLRRALTPALVVTAALYALAPFVTFGWLLPLVFVGGLVPLPIFAVARQSLAAMVPVSRRPTAFALDSMGVELSYLAGPALGVLLATRFAPGTALLLVGAGVVVSGAALLVLNPPTRAGPDSEPDSGPDSGPDGEVRRRAGIRWTPGLAIAIAAAVVATVVLSGTEVAIVAFARAHDALSLTGVVFVTWSLGSMLGAMVYGAMRRPVPVLWLLLALGLLTVPIGLSPGMTVLALAILPAAVACAPVLTATANAVAGSVPDQVLGEAMGWHGSALTAGTALGAPLAGAAMDRYGPWSGFALVGVTGVALALAGFALVGLAGDGVIRSPKRGIRPRRSGAGSLSD